MIPLPLHDLHQSLKAAFQDINGVEVVRDYGDPKSEYGALSADAALLDLSFRSRLCLTGADSLQFLNGQVTNNVKDLAIGQGCYAALINAKGRMQSDLNIYRLAEELLLDFEPGYQELVQQRLEKYIIIEDVQVVDVRPHYGLLTLQGPRSTDVLRKLQFKFQLVDKPMSFATVSDPALGEIYIMHHSRCGTAGYNLFVPAGALERVCKDLIATGVSLAGWEALETRRIELGIPRFGADLDETTLPPEAHLENRAISYTKGCYIGQEVMARLRNYGQAAKTLRALLLPASLRIPPAQGEKIFAGEKEVGFITSAIFSSSMGRWIGLGYLRREIVSAETELRLVQQNVEIPVQLGVLPLSGHV